MNVYKAKDSFPRPISVQHDLTGGEIEMIDADDLDIDGGDTKDSHDVIGYMDDLYEYYINVEIKGNFCCVDKKTYMLHSLCTWLNFSKKIKCGWLKFKLQVRVRDLLAGPLQQLLQLNQHLLRRRVLPLHKGEYPEECSYRISPKQDTCMLNGSSKRIASSQAFPNYFISPTLWEPLTFSGISIYLEKILAMAGSNENCIGGARPSNSQGARKFTAGTRRTRKALSTINQNCVRAAPYPSAVSKRGALKEKKAICRKNVAQIPEFHRPLTRMHAAQIAAKQHEVLDEEIKQPVMETDCSVIDMDVSKARDSDPEPMSVQYDLTDDEIEMIDAEDLDIDGGDKKDPLDVVGYMDDLYEYYRNVENSFCVPPNYMASQTDINEKMRRILIDWLIEVHHKFDLRPETLYLTVNMIDRFLAIQPVIRKKLQLVGVRAMLLARKYEEVWAPFVEDLILISDEAYTRNEVLQMETLMINKLEFDLSVPTVYVFVKRFLKAAESDNEMELLAFYIIDLCLVEYEMLKFPPSMLAAAAVFTAQSTFGKAAQWSKKWEKQTNYNYEEIMKCSKLMVEFHHNAATGRLTAVYKKYNTAKYGYAARIQPAHFLLDS